MEEEMTEDYGTWADQVIEKIRKKISWVSDKNREGIPYTTDMDGNYDNKADQEKKWDRENGLNWWTNGFWGGIMWLLYQDTKDEKYAQIARVSEYQMEQCFDT